MPHCPDSKQGVICGSMLVGRTENFQCSPPPQTSFLPRPATPLAIQTVIGLIAEHQKWRHQPANLDPYNKQFTACSHKTNKHSPHTEITRECRPFRQCRPIWEMLYPCTNKVQVWGPWHANRTRLARFLEPRNLSTCHHNHLQVQNNPPCHKNQSQLFPLTIRTVHRIP